MAPPPDVYGTASGPLARLAEPFAQRARMRRDARFRELVGFTDTTRTVDVGCGTLGLRAHHPGADITGVDLVPRPAYPGPFVQADATNRLPFDDRTFDLTYSSSVIEHLRPADRRAFAHEITRVAKGYWVQTPAFSFPVEPHALLPFAHWLPPPARRRYWRLGAAGAWEEIALLRQAELQTLFPTATIEAERVGPIVKSWVAWKRP